MSIDLHLENLVHIGPPDILFPSFPGSGSTWIANILTELGLCFIDPYTERILSRTSQQSLPVDVASRGRISAYTLRDAKNHLSYREPYRLIKTHFLPEKFKQLEKHRVVLLVRDGRDAVYSFYNWKCGFQADFQHISFSEFLWTPGYRRPQPLVAWAEFNETWISACSTGAHQIIRFEDLRDDPHSHVKVLLSYLGAMRTPQQITSAIEKSTFEAMQQAEHKAMTLNPHLGSGTIMRHGRIGIWREVFKAEDYAAISDYRVMATLDRLNYGGL